MRPRPRKRKRVLWNQNYHVMGDIRITVHSLECMWAVLLGLVSVSVMCGRHQPNLHILINLRGRHLLSQVHPRFHVGAIILAVFICRYPWICVGVNALIAYTSGCIWAIFQLTGWLIELCSYISYFLWSSLWSQRWSKCLEKQKPRLAIIYQQ